MNTRLLGVVGLMVLVLGCADAAQVTSAPMMSRDEGDEWAMGGAAPAPEAAAPAPAPMAKGAARGEMELSTLEEAPADADGRADNASGEGGGDGPTTRAWFPDSFLWRPLVETDAAGVATVDVRVPDTLTSWRVLALAQTRDGQQGGAAHSFDGRLDVWVDAPAPAWLYRGDTIDLPVSVFNATPSALSGALSVSAAGALSGGGGGVVSVGAGGATPRVITLRASGVGPGTFDAAFASADAVHRAVSVRPVGRPVTAVATGSVATTRDFTLRAPPGVDPTSDRIDVLVFPGALSVIAAELDRPPQAHPGPYGFALASYARVLSEAAGAPSDADGLRRLRILTWQRIAGASSSTDPERVVPLLLALSDPSGHELAELAVPRLVRALEQAQRGDGTWGWGDARALDVVIVQTAIAGRALPASSEVARQRAAGAIERLADEVDSPYVAAVVLASGLVDDSTASKLAPVFYEGLSVVDGALGFDVGSVRDAWGAPVSRSEALAWAALAAARSPGEVPAADVATALLGSWTPARGFDAGHAGPVVLEALAATLPSLAAPVDITLSQGGVVKATTRLDPGQPKVPAVLSVPAGGVDAGWTLAVSPAAPGLAWAATRASWVPWTGDERAPGVDVEVALGRLVVGEEGEVVVRVAAPSGVSVGIDLGLPPGAVADGAALLGAAGVASFTLRGDHVEVGLTPMSAGEIAEVRVPVRPMYAGSFATPPIVVKVGGAETALPPPRWVVQP